MGGKNTKIYIFFLVLNAIFIILFSIRNNNSCIYFFCIYHSPLSLEIKNQKVPLLELILEQNIIILHNTVFYVLQLNRMLSLQISLAKS